MRRGDEESFEEPSILEESCISSINPSMGTGGRMEMRGRKERLLIDTQDSMGKDVEGMILAIEGYLEEGRELEAKKSVLELKELLLGATCLSLDVLVA